MKTHRVAIVGTGNSVGNHLRAIASAGERVELVAAVDLRADRVQAVCQEHGIPNWHTDISKMLERESPDLVCVVTPPATHLPIAIECLEAGAWVYCEKPLCGSLADFEKIRAVEQYTGRYVSTVAQWRFGSAGKHLKRLIRAGTLGKPLVATCHTLWYRNQAYYDVEWRGAYKTEFGGTTMTLGVHLVDLLLWLLPDWQEVQAMISTLDRDIEVEDVAMAMVRFKGGAMGSIVNSVLSPRQVSHLRLDFQQASVEVSTLYRYSNQHWQFSLPPNVENDKLRAEWDSLATDLPGSHDVQLGEILDSLERNQPPPVNGAEARRILEFNASLYKSALTGQPVQRGEIDADDPFYYAMNGSTETMRP